MCNSEITPGGNCIFLLLRFHGTWHQDGICRHLVLRVIPVINHVHHFAVYQRIYEGFYVKKKKFMMLDTCSFFNYVTRGNKKNKDCDVKSKTNQILYLTITGGCVLMHAK